MSNVPQRVTKHDESKLPQWAQDLIALLRTNLEDERKFLLSKGDKYNTRIIVGPHRAQPVAFNAEETVRFYLDGAQSVVRPAFGPHEAPPPRNGTYVDVRIDNGGLYVSLSGRMSDAVHVIPHAANAVSISPGKFS